MYKTGLALLLGAATIVSQTPTRNYAAEGDAAFRAGRYAQAIELFEQAATAAPSDATPHMYMAAAYVQQIKAGTNSPENDQFARNAERELQAVLSLQPENLQAMQSLATLHSNLAGGKANPAEKTRELDEAAYWYRKIVGMQPGNKVAHYSLGVIAWSKAYPQVMQIRQQLGMRPETPGPIANAEARTALKARVAPTLQEGMHHLQKALEVDPAYSDAMAYLNLLHRQQADLADSAEQHAREIKTADSYVQRALQAKRSQPQQANSNAAPPPPPPPPPADGSQLPGAQAELPRQIRVGGQVQAAKLIDRPQPEYPPLAMQSRIQGVVRFNVTISPEGSVTNVTLTSGHPLLVPSATEALRGYRYQPTLLNGQPVEVISPVDVNFTLP